jgi:prepilin-type N-terminal cleavage/methylation domain-containing protein
MTQAGYTLIELTISLSLTAAIAATAVPTASAYLQQHRLASVARRLGFDIARTRMQAVGQNRFVRLSLLGTGVYRRESSTDGVTYAADGETVSLPPGFSLSVTSNGMPRFDRQGVAPSSTSITVMGPRGNQTVTTTILGRVTTS